MMSLKNKVISLVAKILYRFGFVKVDNQILAAMLSMQNTNASLKLATKAPPADAETMSFIMSMNIDVFVDKSHTLTAHIPTMCLVPDGPRSEAYLKTTPRDILQLNMIQLCMVAAEHNCNRSSSDYTQQLVSLSDENSPTTPTVLN